MEKKGLVVTDKPLISFKAHQEWTLPASDWIVFTSVNMVRFFLEKTAVPPGVKVAAVGAKTANYLKQHKVSCHFIGEGSDTSLIAKEFVKFCKNSCVLFAGSEQGKKNIQTNIQQYCTVIDQPLYTTVIEPEYVAEQHIYIFTSPSNVISFFKNNVIENKEVWAIGNTTKEALKQKNIRNILMPDTSSVDDIIGSILTS